MGTLVPAWTATCIMAAHSSRQGMLVDCAGATLDCSNSKVVLIFPLWLMRHRCTEVAIINLYWYLKTLEFLFVQSISLILIDSTLTLCRSKYLNMPVETNTGT